MKFEIEDGIVTLDYNGNGYSGFIRENNQPATRNWDSEHFVSFTLILDDVNFGSNFPDLFDILDVLGENHLFTLLYKMNGNDYTNIDIDAVGDSVTLTVGVDKLCNLVGRYYYKYPNYVGCKFLDYYQGEHLRDFK